MSEKLKKEKLASELVKSDEMINLVVFDPFRIKQGICGATASVAVTFRSVHCAHRPSHSKINKCLYVLMLLFVCFSG